MSRKVPAVVAVVVDGAVTGSYRYTTLKDVTLAERPLDHIAALIGLRIERRRPATGRALALPAANLVRLLWNDCLDPPTAQVVPGPLGLTPVWWTP